METKSCNAGTLPVYFGPLLAQLKFKRIGTHFGRFKGRGGSLLHGRALSSGRAEGFLHGEGCSPRRAARPARLHLTRGPTSIHKLVPWGHLGLLGILGDPEGHMVQNQALEAQMAQNQTA